MFQSSFKNFSNKRKRVVPNNHECLNKEHYMIQVNERRQHRTRPKKIANYKPYLTDALQDNYRNEELSIMN